MEWRKLADLTRGRKTYIQTHNYPDADAIASAFALQHLLSTEGIAAQPCYVGKIDKLNTIQMVGVELWELPKPLKTLRFIDFQIG